MQPTNETCLPLATMCSFPVRVEGPLALRADMIRARLNLCAGPRVEGEDLLNDAPAGVC
jgi:hypothetical protein